MGGMGMMNPMMMVSGPPLGFIRSQRSACVLMSQGGMGGMGMMNPMMMVRLYSDFLLLSRGSFELTSRLAQGMGGMGGMGMMNPMMMGGYVRCVSHRPSFSLCSLTPLPTPSSPLPSHRSPRLYLPFADGC